MKPYYDHDGITIYLGDCREVLPTLGKFDLLLTDPPYGIGIDTAYRLRRPKASGPPGKPKTFANDFPPVFGDGEAFEPAPLLPIAAAAILWGANNYADKLPASPMWLAWDRQTSGDSTPVELAWVTGHRFRSVRIFRHLWEGLCRASEYNQKTLHPTQKPVALMRWCLSFFPDARTVIDPYMGSGPVARASKDAGLTYVGIEIEERYAEIAAKRCAQQVLFA